MRQWCGEPCRKRTDDSNALFGPSSGFEEFDCFLNASVYEVLYF